MKIEWHEDTAQGTQERPAWAIKGTVGDVAVERRSDVALNTSTRRLENLRLEVLDGIRAGLGLQQDAIREEDITGVAAAMGALRRMALEALLHPQEQHDARMLGLTLEFATVRPAAQEEPDTIEAVVREWEAQGNVARWSASGRLVYFRGDGGDLVAAWDTQAGDGLPIQTADGGWHPGALNDLRAALGWEVKS